MNKQKNKITLYFYLGYLPMAAADALRVWLTKGPVQAVTPLHALYALVCWGLLSSLYFKTTPTAKRMDATMNMAFTWLFTAMALDVVRWVSIPHAAAMRFGAFLGANWPWLILSYAATFAAPFLSASLRARQRRGVKPAPGKKLVIIGGGIGGLTAAVYASRAGFDTVLYEQHDIAGGECTGWDRQGYHIDNCIHWMMGSQPGTALHDLWQTVGAADAAGMYRADRMYTSELNGETLTLWQDIDRTEREMIALSPADEAEIRKLMDLCRLSQGVSIPAVTPSELMSPGDLMKLSGESKATLRVFNAYKGMDVRDLTARFQHPLIRCAIADFTPMESRASSFPMAYGNFVSGDGGIPRGGSRAMALRMRAKAESYGAKVVTGMGVEKILLANGHAAGVRLSNGTEVPCDYIIPACDASVTFGKLLPESYREPLLQTMYEKREAYPIYNTFQTALALDDEADPFPAEVIFDCPALAFTPGMGTRITIKSYGYEPGFAPAGKQILQTLQGGSESVFPFWTALYEDRAAYAEKKRELAELTRAQVEAKFPALKGKLRVLDAWTPMTYVRYCSAYKGFYQSFQITKHSARLPYPSPYVKGLDNVVLGGQWVNLPGGLPGAAIASKFAVQRVLYLAGCDERV